MSEHAHEPPLSPFSRRAADALADEVAALVLRGLIDSRSPAADALLDYRTPPASERAERLAATDADLAATRRRADAAVKLLRVVRMGSRCVSGRCGSCALCRSKPSIDKLLADSDGGATATATEDE